MGILLLLGTFFVALLCGVPVAFAMGLSALAAFFHEGFPLLITFQRINSGISIFSLLAIPFFIFAGELMLHGGIAIRLVRFASALVGHVRGGLASVNIMIIFSIAAGGGISVSKLFLAGVVPGVLMCACLAFVAWLIAIRHGYPSEPFPGWGTVARTAAVALPGFVTAVIIVGGVLSGVFTVTESGAFGAIYALLLTAFAYRSLSCADFRTAVVSSVRTTAMVMILIGCANAFGYLLALYEVPATLSDLLLSVSRDPLVILFMINVMLLLLGMIMDMAALILICTPIFLPIAVGTGMDPIQFGIMLLMNLGLGLYTPPVGSCLFVGCAVGRVPIEQAVRTIWPFYLAMFAALMLVTYVPIVSLGLPALLG